MGQSREETGEAKREIEKGREEWWGSGSSCRSLYF